MVTIVFDDDFRPGIIEEVGKENIRTGHLRPEVEANLSGPQTPVVWITNEGNWRAIYVEPHSLASETFPLSERPITELNSLIHGYALNYHWRKHVG